MVTLLGGFECGTDRIFGADGDRVAGVMAAFYFVGWSSHDWLPVGDTATLRATAYTGGWPSRDVYDSYASEAEAQRAHWTSSDPLVATVGPTGLVTALRPGVTKLRVAFEGVEGDGPTLTVYPSAASVAVEPTTAEAEVGGIVTFRVVARDDTGQPVAGVPVTLYSSEYRVAGPTGNLRQASTPGEQPYGAWRAGTVTLSAFTPHPRPAGRLEASAVLTVTDPGVAPDTLPRSTSDAVLRVAVGRSTLRRGDTTTVRLVLRNPSAAPLRFTASPSCAVTFDVREGGGTTAWPLGPRACDAAVAHVVAPGDSLVREEVWRADDGRTPAPAPLTPGLYWIFPMAGGDGYFAIGALLTLRVLP